MKLDLAHRLDRLFSARPDPRASRCGHSLEILEARIAPAGVSVTSIVRAGGAAPDTAAGSVAYTVTFSEAVSGVDATDFLVHTEGNAHATSPVMVAAVSTTVYTVTASGLHGQGDVRLDLIDHDSITGASGVLGGAGAGNGSFQGAAYHLLQTFPKVSSITAVGSINTSASSVSWTVTLSAPVIGVDATDFTLVKSGVSADAAVTVTPVSSTVYTVTATHVSGTGTLALKLVDDGTIKDANGNPLQGTTPPTFAANTDFTTGSYPHSVAVADVNGDGKPDLVSANTHDNTVSVLLGNGSGGFAAKTDFATGTHPRAVAVADVNGDGKPDLVMANYSDGTVSVLLGTGGTGSGAFTAKTDFATGSNPISVAVADVNGDGKPDLVMANFGTNTVSVLLGAGSGAFAAKTDFITGSNPSSVAVADVNGDDKPDLVTANSSGSNVSVLLGNGSGGFGTRTDFTAGSSPFSVAVADVNGDGHPDLVVGNAGTGMVSVLLGDGSGGFAARTHFASGGNPIPVAVADVNGDGHPDLVIANGGSNTVSVLLGDGSGGFAANADFGTGSYPISVAIADVNGDGHPDLLTANYDSGAASVLLGAGGGTFTGDAFAVVPLKVTSITHVGSANLSGTSQDWTVTFNGDVTGVDASDFTALTSGGAHGGAISVAGSGHVYTVTVAGLHGSGDVRLDLVDNDSITNGNPLGGTGLSNGSFQGDGVHLLQTYPTTVSSITQDGSTTTRASSVSWTVTLSAPVTGVDATDFMLVKNGVSADAAVTVTPVSSTVYRVTATHVSVSSDVASLGLTLVDYGTIKDAAGNPLQGNVPPSFVAQASFATGSEPLSVAVADVNGDGRPDLVTANYVDHNVSVLLGTGSGGFAARTDFATGTFPHSVEVADVNGDGRPDLVIANYDNTVSVLLGNGSGGFAAPTTFTTGATPVFAVADVNGDGRPDLVVANYASNTVSVLLGNGSGGFAARTDFATGTEPHSVAVADVNGDGRLDVVTANLSGNNVSVLLGDGSGGLAAKTDFATGTHPYSVAVADVNGDGRPDLVTANAGSSNVSVLLGNGSGGFAAKTDFATGSRPKSVAVADVNGDGQPDVVTANSSGHTVSVLLGNGSGGLAAKTDFATGRVPVSVAVADVNGDGRPDLVTAISNDDTVRVLLGVSTFTGDAFTIVPPTVSIADTSVAEGNSGNPHATFTVTLSDVSAVPVTVDYSTSDRTAIAPGDYTAIHHGTVTFAPGDTTATIDVAIRPDTLFESGANETFTVDLDDSANATIAVGQAVGTILSDDGAPAHTIAFDAKNPFTFFDHNHDKVTVKLSGLAAGTLILDGGVTDGADISEIHLAGDVKSTLSIAVAKDKHTGDGLVKVGEIIVDGALAGFSGPAVDLTVGGLRATGVVKTITAHSFAGEIFTGGAATDKLALTLGAVAAGSEPFVIATPETISALKTVSVGPGEIDAAALTAISVSAGSFAADVTSDGAIGSISVKGGGLSGHLTAVSFGAVSITGGGFSGSLTSATPAAAFGNTKALTSLFITGGSLTGAVDLLGPSGAITVKTGGESGNLTAASFSTVTVTGGSFSGSLTSTATVATLGRIKALTGLSVTGGNLSGDVDLLGAVGAITVRTGTLSGHLTAASFGAVVVTGGGFGGTLTSTATAVTLGATKALAALSVTTGDLTGDVNLLGTSGAITVNTGGVSGHLTAASFGAVAVTGGDFAGSLTSLTPAATLGRNKALTSLTVSDGSLTGDVRLLGASGAITVKAKPALLAAGSITGASIVASAIASLTVGRDFISSIVLAGADLGDDYAFGGTTSAADTFAAGTIGAVKIGRNVSGAGSIIGAGFSTPNAILKDGDDAIVGGVASVIASLTVTGTAAPESYFAAGLFKAAPKINGAVVVPATDARFKVA